MLGSYAIHSYGQDEPVVARALNERRSASGPFTSPLASSRRGALWCLLTRFFCNDGAEGAGISVTAGGSASAAILAGR